MNTRKIKDGKVDGEKIYFKSHAKATYMSDGRTVEEAVNSINTGDLSQYATKTDLDGKVDKIAGKQLSTEDFTTTLKQKLEGLSNYNDTNIQASVSKLRTDLDTLVSGDTTSAIKTFNEVIAFLDGISDAEDLSGIISSIEQQIAGKYTKPSTGIIKNDLASDVQTSLGKADTALQSYTEQYKGTITGVSANGTSVATSGVANIPAASTSAYGVTKLSSATNSTSTSLAATASAVKAAYDLANSYKGTVTGVKVNGTTKTPSSGTVDLGTVITDISGKADKIAVVNHGTSSTTFTLTPNVLHVWGAVTKLTITLGTANNATLDEFMFQFTSGSTATNLSLPNTIKWIAEPNIEANKIYQCSIINNIGVIAAANNA